MCGRFTLRTPAQEIAKLFDITTPDFDPRYNIAPSQGIAVVRQKPDNDKRELVMLHWGLIPFWSDGPDEKYKMINARAETVAEKPAYRAAFKKRRCLIAADGFYEWKKSDDGKQPYFIHMQDDRPFAFAGLWEHWEDEDGDDRIESCMIIVTEANDLLEPIHDRMPVILKPDDYDLWLDPEFEKREKLEEMLQAYPDDEMEAYPVSRKVNNPQNDVEECIEEVEAT